MVRAGLRLVGGAGVVLALGCSGIPAGAPGSATCTVGRTQRTISCQDICRKVQEARSGSERDDLIRCADAECDVDCR
jgi:hypothetical protein